MESQVKAHVLNHNLSLFVRYMPGHLETMFTDTGFKLNIKGKKYHQSKKTMMKVTYKIHTDFPYIYKKSCIILTKIGYFNYIVTHVIAKKALTYIKTSA